MTKDDVLKRLTRLRDSMQENKKYYGGWTKQSVNAWVNITTRNDESDINTRGEWMVTANHVYKMIKDGK